MIGRARIKLVDVTGIEPVTPCLQRKFRKVMWLILLAFTYVIRARFRGCLGLFVSKLFPRRSTEVKGDSCAHLHHHFRVAVTRPAIRIGPPDCIHAGFTEYRRHLPSRLAKPALDPYSMRVWPALQKLPAPAAAL